MHDASDLCPEQEEQKEQSIAIGDRRGKNNSLPSDAGEDITD